jgi:hypothetical protein
VPVPNCTLSPAWADAWLGHELTMLAEGLAPKTIMSRKASFNSVAKHAMVNDITDPG